MNAQYLTPATHLKAGSDLWIVPELEESPFTMGVDWYINFQIAAALRHKSAVISETLETTLKACELEKYTLPSKLDQGLLIATKNNLPNRWVLFLPGAKSSTRWLENCLEHWEKLGKPSLRFFLPKSMDKAKFQQTLSQINVDCDVTALTAELW